MRLFVALLPPPDVLAELDQAVRELLYGLPGADRLRWTGSDGRHVTLAFLGEVEEGSLAGLVARLERPARRHGPYDEGLRGGGRFGSGVLWAGVTGDDLVPLARAVRAGARRAGAGVSGTRFRAHLTLARASGAVDLRPFAAALAEFAGPTWRAEDLALVRSHPPAPGVPGARPVYETLRTWPLGG